MDGDAVNPLEWIQGDRGRAGARVRGCLQSRAVVIQFLERVHGQGGAGDVPGLTRERDYGGAVDRGSGKDGEARVHPGKQVAHEVLRETPGPVEAPEQQAAQDLHLDYSHDSSGNLQWNSNRQRFSWPAEVAKASEHETDYSERRSLPSLSRIPDVGQNAVSDLRANSTWRSAHVRLQCSLCKQALL